MSVSTRNPLRVLGGAATSGNANTGELQVTRGGVQLSTIYSGIIAAPGLTAAPGAVAAGSDVLLCSGGGRLNSIIPHLVSASGQRLLFYDAVAATSGGPLYTSGHRVIGVLPAATDQNLVNSGVYATPIGPITLDTPFLSGLCVATRSGCVGFSVAFTPEANPSFG